MRAELPGPIEAPLSGRLKKKTDQILGKDVLPPAPSCAIPLLSRYGVQCRESSFLEKDLWKTWLAIKPFRPRIPTFGPILGDHSIFKKTTAKDK